MERACRVGRRWRSCQTRCATSSIGEPVQSSRPSELSRSFLGLPYRWGGTDTTHGDGLLRDSLPGDATARHTPCHRDADDQYDEAPFRSRKSWESAQGWGSGLLRGGFDHPRRVLSRATVTISPSTAWGRPLSAVCKRTRTGVSLVTRTVVPPDRRRIPHAYGADFRSSRRSKISRTAALSICVRSLRRSHSPARNSASGRTSSFRAPAS